MYCEHRRGAKSVHKFRSFILFVLCFFIAGAHHQAKEPRRRRKKSEPNENEIT